LPWSCHRPTKQLTRSWLTLSANGEIGGFRVRLAHGTGRDTLRPAPHTVSGFGVPKEFPADRDLKLFANLGGEEISAAGYRVRPLDESIDEIIVVEGWVF